MSKEVSAQNKIMNGSFIKAIVGDEKLEKGMMYRIKSNKSSGKYVVLDTDFSGNQELKGVTIAFKGRFTLMSEDEVKQEFKRLLEVKGFTRAGQEFYDVRDKTLVSVDSNSRTHMLVKFGKIMGVKHAGGHVWFAGNKWAVTENDPETMPEPEEEQPTSDPQTDYVFIHCETKTEATHVCNLYGGGEREKFILDWDVYGDETVYKLNTISSRLETYGSYPVQSKQKRIPIKTYTEWFGGKKQSKQTKTPMQRTGTLEEQILSVVEEHLDSQEARAHMSNSVEKLLNHWGIDKNVRQLEVKVNDKPAVKVGKVHFKYDLLFKCVAARTNIALVGAAGSGKTTTVAKVAEALELPFYSKSVSAQTGSHEFFGYQDAQGRYVRTLFREAYENGGVFLLDEFDAGNPNVLAALNQATANEHCAFADGMIPKHKDFICVMAGNTFGHGANSEYVGRNKIDAATLDRFAFIDFPYDEDLEYALAPDKNWCKKVQAFRKKASDKQIRTVISPRATIMGGQLMAQGVSEKDVMELVIFKGLNQEERNLLK